MKNMDFEMDEGFEAEEEWEEEEQPTITENRYGVVKVTPYTNHYMLVFDDDEGNCYYSPYKTDQFCSSSGLRLIGVYVFYMLADEGIFLFKELFNNPTLDTNWIKEEVFWDYIEVDEELFNKHPGYEWSLIEISGDI